MRGAHAPQEPWRWSSSSTTSAITTELVPRQVVVVHLQGRDDKHLVSRQRCQPQPGAPVTTPALGTKAASASARSRRRRDSASAGCRGGRASQQAARRPPAGALVTTPAPCPGAARAPAPPTGGAAWPDTWCCGNSGSRNWAHWTRRAAASCDAMATPAPGVTASAPGATGTLMTTPAPGTNAATTPALAAGGATTPPPGVAASAPAATRALVTTPAPGTMAAATSAPAAGGAAAPEPGVEAMEIWATTTMVHLRRWSQVSVTRLTCVAGSLSEGLWRVATTTKLP